jgi:CPA1 family monovalent cation:H+ antiporter
MSTFLLTTLSAITLLSLSVAVAMVAKRYRFPYTVALVGFGMLLAYAAKVPMFAFIDDFQLTPGVLLYVFLPILLFEAAYNIGYKDFFRNVKSISALAVVSLLISAVLVGY